MPLLKTIHEFSFLENITKIVPAIGSVIPNPFLPESSLKIIKLASGNVFEGMPRTLNPFESGEKSFVSFNTESRDPKSDVINPGLIICPTAHPAKKHKIATIASKIFILQSPYGKVLKRIKPREQWFLGDPFGLYQGLDPYWGQLYKPSINHVYLPSPRRISGEIRSMDRQNVGTSRTPIPSR